MVDADGATKISDVERLEKALSKLAKDHVSFSALALLSMKTPSFHTLCIVTLSVTVDCACSGGRLKSSSSGTGCG